MSVNLSGRQLQDPNLLQDVRTALSFSGLNPQRLVLEITESVLMINREDVAKVLREFRLMGIRIAIDDFATGYSSLSFLRQFPIDILKIDKSFIDLLGDASGDGHHVRARPSCGSPETCAWTPPPKASSTRCNATSSLG